MLKIMVNQNNQLMVSSLFNICLGTNPLTWGKRNMVVGGDGGEESITFLNEATLLTGTGILA